MGVGVAVLVGLIVRVIVGVFVKVLVGTAVFVGVFVANGDEHAHKYGCAHQHLYKYPDEHPNNKSYQHSNAYTHPGWARYMARSACAAKRQAATTYYANLEDGGVGGELPDD